MVNLALTITLMGLALLAINSVLSMAAQPCQG